MFSRYLYCRSALIAFISVLGFVGSAQAQLRLKPYASGFSTPVGMVQDPAEPSVQFVVEQGGLIRVVQAGVVSPQPFLDVRGLIGCCGERGLLGLAFPPDSVATRRFYVNYTNQAGDTVIARYKRSAANPMVADASTWFPLMWASIGNLPFIPHNPPYGNHNGGDLAFGSDGYLYIGMGDGGSGNDPQNHAQDPNSLLGKMLRIDVNVPDGDFNGYRVPLDNPFPAGNPIGALPEIWDFGMRNPWRFNFDVGTGGTGALIIADVGQGSREEIDYEPARAGGRNYGWSIREGFLPNITTRAPAFLPLRDPIHDYDRSFGNVVTGGYVYRGTSLGQIYRGRYFFADFGSARVWSIGLNVNPTTGEASKADFIEHTEELGGSAVIGNVSSFGRDSFGELYLVQYGGTIMKLEGLLPAPRLLLPGDFNGDGVPDLLAQHQGGAVRFVLNNGSSFIPERTVFDGQTTWQVVGTGDFNFDSQPDLVWQSSTGSVIVWLMNGSTMMEARFIFAGTTTWRLAAVADIDHAGSSDLIWQSATGQIIVWYMQGTGSVGWEFIFSGSTVWRLVASADFNADGESDLIWQNPTGAVVIWLMRRAMFSAMATVFSGTTAWQLVSAGDVDGDRQADLVWFGPGGAIIGWLLHGTSIAQYQYLKPIGGGWRLSSTP